MDCGRTDEALIEDGDNEAQAAVGEGARWGRGASVRNSLQGDNDEVACLFAFPGRGGRGSCWQGTPPRPGNKQARCGHIADDSS